MITLGDVASWILINRKNTSFKDFTYKDLIVYLSKKSNCDEMLLVLKGSNISGLVCYTPKENKELFIDDILSTEKDAVKQMMNICKIKFPHYIITGIHRSGRLRNFKDQNRLTRLLP